MNLTKLAKSIIIGTATVTAVGLGAQGCTQLANSPLGQALGLNVVGVTPTEEYGSNGAIDFSMFAQDSATDAVLQTNLQNQGMRVSVKNDDGSTYTPCNHLKSDTEEGSEFNTLTMLIDDSGSMGLEATPEVLELCATCPHDPDRLRASAAERLAATLLEKTPDSRIAVARFGPSIDEGMLGTEMLSDFSGDLSDVRSAILNIDGSAEAGTPLWDSLADMIGVTETEGSEYESILQSRGTMNSVGLPAEVKRVIVVLSDGQDTDSITHDLQSVIDLANTNAVEIYAIGLGPASAENTDPRLQLAEVSETVIALAKMADATGGFYSSVHDASGLEELYERVATSLAEGYQVETYECRPRPNADAPPESGRIPSRGEKVEGKVEVEGETKDWSMIAP